MPFCLNACPDCPARRNSELEVFTGDLCTLRSIPVRGREPLPSEWFGGAGFMVMRRGIVVRQRVDASGGAVAIDAIGPGAAAPLWSVRGATSGGYAASDALVCLVPKRLVVAGSPRAGNLGSIYEALLVRVERIAEARSRRGAFARVAALVCALTDCLAPPNRLDLVPASLQQRDLAALLAMRHESVCRVLGALERRSLLQRVADGIRVLDRAGLERF